jgi:GT2 family glycosyltransferase
MEFKTHLVSLIVISYNEIDHISNSLNALMGQSYPNFEVIVYDNGSIDGTPEYVEKHYPQVKLIKGAKNLGFGGANNQATKIARGKYVGFLNCDAVVSPSWLEPIIELLEKDNTIGCVGAELLCSENQNMILSHGTGIHLSGISYARDKGKVAGSSIEPIEVGGVSGGAFLINREFFLEIGGFESLFFLYYEDTDLSLRIRLLGKRCVVMQGARVYHNCESRFGARKIFFLERNRYISLFSLMNLWILLIMMPSMIIFEVFSWGYCLLNGKEALLSKINAWKSIYEYREFIKIRRKKNTNSVANISFVLQAFTPFVHLDYAHPNRLFGVFSLVIGYIVAIIPFFVLRIITGRTYFR